MKVMKHEWHQVDSRYTFEITEHFLSEIYTENSEEEISNLYKDIQNGEFSIEDVMDDAWEHGVEIDWEHDYDDWWTSRKGGYDVTYDLIEGDE